MPTFPTLPDWVQLEHQVAHILQKQEEHGWYFNEREAYELESTLRREMEDYCVQDTIVTKKLCQQFHPYLIGSN